MVVACMMLVRPWKQPVSSLLHYKKKPPTLNADQFKRNQNIFIESVLNHINKRICDLDTNHILRFMQVFYPANMPVTEAEEAVNGEDL